MPSLGGGGHLLDSTPGTQPISGGEKLYPTFPLSATGGVPWSVGPPPIDVSGEGPPLHVASRSKSTCALGHGERTF